MKSMMQEATSVIKAIEKAWDNAGRPKDFSIKVFQEPKKNFIGLTVENAKIGIFFDEKEHLVKPEAQPSGQRQPTHPRKQAARSGGLTEQRPKELRPLAPKARQAEQAKLQPKGKPQEPLERKAQERILWNESMIALAHEWLKETLTAMNLSGVPFKTEVNNYHLKITFEAPLASDQDKERDIFRSFAFLMMQTLRHKLKRPLRGFKVVLTRPQASQEVTRED